MLISRTVCFASYVPEPFDAFYGHVVGCVRIRRAVFFEAFNRIHKGDAQPVFEGDRCGDEVPVEDVD